MITVTQSAKTPVTLTEAAARRVLDQLERRTDAKGLRFGVRKNGCSGLAYVVDLVDEFGVNDHVFQDRGVTIVVDADSLLSVSGTEIDYAAEGPDGLSTTFQFRNPNVTGSCGCGESFSVN